MHRVLAQPRVGRLVEQGSLIGFLFDFQFLKRLGVFGLLVKHLWYRLCFQLLILVAEVLESFFVVVVVCISVSVTNYEPANCDGQCGLAALESCCK